MVNICPDYVTEDKRKKSQHPLIIHSQHRLASSKGQSLVDLGVEVSPTLGTVFQR